MCCMILLLEFYSRDVKSNDCTIARSVTYQGPSIEVLAAEKMILQLPRKVPQTCDVGSATFCPILSMYLRVSEVLQPIAMDVSE